MDKLELMSLNPSGKTLPLTVENNQGLPLAQVIHENKAAIDIKLREFGAVVFKGFGVDAVSQFEKVSEQLCDHLYTQYGDLPSISDSKKVYGATPYPADMTIYFHNEASHTPTFPSKQLFLCVKAAPQGGGLSIVDGRQVLKKLPKEVVEEFRVKKLKYYRSFIPYIDVKWQDFFGTTDKEELESICRNEGLNFKWKDRGIFSTNRIAPAVVTHPATMEATWFNQIQLHHPGMMEEEDYHIFRRSYEEIDFPRYVCYGDDTPISKETLTLISDVLEQEASTVYAKEGDIIYVDNLLVAHSRLPFKGDRKVRVALGDPIVESDLPRHS